MKRRAEQLKKFREIGKAGESAIISHIGEFVRYMIRQGSVAHTTGVALEPYRYKQEKGYADIYPTGSHFMVNKRVDGIPALPGYILVSASSNKTIGKNHW